MGRDSRQRTINRIERRTVEARAGIADVMAQNRRYEADVERLARTVGKLRCELEWERNEKAARLAEAIARINLYSNKIRELRASNAKLQRLACHHVCPHRHIGDALKLSIDMQQALEGLMPIPLERNGQRTDEGLMVRMTLAAQRMLSPEYPHNFERFFAELLWNVKKKPCRTYRDHAQSLWDQLVWPDRAEQEVDDG